MTITRLFSGIVALCVLLTSTSAYAQEATPEVTPEATSEAAPQTLSRLPEVQAVTIDRDVLPPLLVGLTAAPANTPALCEGVFDAEGVQAWGSAGPMRSGELVRLDSLASDAARGFVTNTFFPMICSAEAIDMTEAQAIAPDGTSIPALLYAIQPLADAGDDRLAYVIQLPLFAYTQPGLWNLTSLAMPDYMSIGVRLPDDNAPFALRYPPALTLLSAQDTSLIFVGGFVPEEHVIGVLLNEEGYIGEFTFQADENGFALLSPDAESLEGTLLFVGQFGSVITGPPDTLFDVDGQTLPQIEVARILYDSHWSTTGVSIETTPEADSESTPEVEVTDPEATEAVEATEEPDEEEDEPTAVPAPPQPSGVMASAEELARARLCPNTPAPRLTVGRSGRVTPGLPNNLRSQPTQTAERLLRIPAGATFSVLAGPQCGDGYTWWQVDYNGTVGWTAEGGGNEYWVEPA